ncbi:MAG: formate dehydrogenase accessory sulfurtransferase FdhD [Rhodobacteraceae bacterium]|nr:formate dehydrogenase accessory sulfurtransferase FdhD [Paracoccaceae bacterium]
METFAPKARLAFRAGRWESGQRAVPAEVPVAIVYNGTTQAVMMATPADLLDFGAGFSLTEGIISELSEIKETEVVTLDQGIELRLWLVPAAEARFQARRRAQVGPVGCGLCGIDSLSEALRALPRLASHLRWTPADAEAAMKGLVRHQTLNGATRASHAAGFYRPGQGVVLAREDVGRHNALDKLASAMAQAGLVAGDGALVLTSRVSVDMVQKAAMIGAPVVMAASAPTTLAIAEADAAGITLVGILRGADFEIFTHPERFDPKEAADVA